MVSEKMLELGRRRSVIRELFEYGRTRRAEIGEDRVFDFSLGNPSVPAPAVVGDTLAALLRETDPALLHGYTSAQGDARVREAIAAYVRQTYRAPADADRIYLTAGAAAALSIALRALLPDGGGDEVIAIAPYFPEYRVFTENAGGRLVPVPARAGDFGIDIPGLLAAVTPRTRAVIINSPNNPTGAVLSPSDAAALGEALRSASERVGHPIYLLADEPYRELVYDGVTVPWLPLYYENTMVLYSFSKSLSLPGERIGYVLVHPDAAAAEEVYAAILGAGRSLGYVCAPALFQYMIPACLGKTSDLQVYRENRDRLYTALTRYGYDCVRPEGAFYLFVRALEPDAVAFSERAKKRELLLVPSDDFGYPGYVRIAYCVSPQMVERALPAFRALAEDYRKGS